jgi:predicted methyltransferase
MDKTSVLKMIYEKESALNKVNNQNITLEDLVRSDRKLRKLISDLENEQLVQYINSKLHLTHMGKYLAKTL